MNFYRKSSFFLAGCPPKAFLLEAALALGPIFSETEFLSNNW
jgi:hypothetical protein